MSAELSPENARLTPQEATGTLAGKFRGVILDQIAVRVGQVPDVHPRLLEGIEAAARHIASEVSRMSDQTPDSVTPAMAIEAAVRRHSRHPLRLEALGNRWRCVGTGCGFEGTLQEHDAHVASEIERILTDRIAAAKAEAWDEGEEAGRVNHFIDAGNCCGSCPAADCAIQQPRMTSPYRLRPGGESSE